MNSSKTLSTHFEGNENPFWSVCIRYGLLPMVLFPKLTKVDEGKVCLSLPTQSKCESYIVLERAYNLVYITT